MERLSNYSVNFTGIRVHAKTSYELDFHGCPPPPPTSFFKLDTCIQKSPCKIVTENTQGEKMMIPTLLSTLL